MSDPDEQVAHALWALAEEFLHQNQIKDAILCLESICQSSIRFSSETEVKTCIRLAELYVRYTENIDKAKEHLDRSLLLVPNIKNESEYKLNILFLLSRVYELRGQKTQLKQILKRGTEFSAFPRWYQFFQMELSKLLTSEGEYAYALECLELGFNCTQKIDESDPTKILFILSQAQISLLSNNYDASSSFLCSAERSIAFLSKEINDIESDNDTVHGVRMLHMNSPIKSPACKRVQKKRYTFKMLKVHYLILNLIYLIQTSNFKQANRKLENLLELVSSISTEYDSVFYTWMPMASLYSCTYLLSTICHRPIANMNTAIGFARKGIDLIDSVLVKEANLTPSAIPIGRNEFINSLVRYKFLLLENLVYLHLSMCKLEPAINYIGEAVVLYEKHSTVISDGMCIIHVLLGLYASCIGVTDYAIVHFQSANSKTENADYKAIILVYLSLIYLKTDALNKVSSMVHMYNASMLTHPNRVIRAGILLIEGLLYYHQGNNVEARAKIKECLGVANGSLSHNQLAATTLNALGASFLAESTANFQQATTVLRSSLVLSYRCEDFYSKLHSLNLLSIVYDKKQDHINQGYTLRYKTQQEKDWSQAVYTARKLPATIKLLTKYIQIEPKPEKLIDPKSNEFSPMQSIENLTQIQV